MTFATAVLILYTSFVYCTAVYWSVIHDIQRKPHLSVVWNWYHFVAIAISHQPRPMDMADINTRLQLSDTSSIPPVHGGFLLCRKTNTSLRMIFRKVAHWNCNAWCLPAWHEWFCMRLFPMGTAHNNARQYEVAVCIQYTPRNMHTVLLCFALLWLCNRS